MIWEIISGTTNHTLASVAIKSKALSVSTSDHDRFVELIETELLSIHEGNFARYRITPGEFAKWRSVWEK